MADSYITDPDLLKQLDTTDEGGAYVSDPELLKQLDGEAVSAKPARRSYANELAQTLQKSNLFTSATSAAEGAWDKDIRRTESGEWDLPLMAPIKPAEGILGSVVSTIGGATTALGQKLGARMDLAGPGVDKQAVQSAFNDFQKANNLSDEEVQTAWKDFGNINRTWQDDEKLRVLSNGTIFPNQGASEWLDAAKAEEIISKAPTSDEAKQAMRDKLPDIRNAIAANKLEAYEAASDTVNKATAAQSLGSLGLSRAVAGKFTPPSEWAKQQGRTDTGTPEFVRDYENAVVNDAPWIRQKLWGLAGKAVTGWGQVANTVLGLGGMAGSETAAKLAGEGAEAQQTISQGLPDTGVVGAAVEQVPSLITQMVTGRLIGAAGSSTATTLGTFGMAGAQSAGMTYADLISQGVDPQTARDKAVKTGVSTAVITSLFGTGSMGGVESAIAGKEIGEVTMKELVDLAREQGVKNFATSPQFRSFVGTVLKEAGGEAAEEGIDQFAQAFLTADPDTSVADAWSQAKDAAMVGGALGGGVQLAMKAMPNAPEAARAAMQPVSESPVTQAETRREGDTEPATAPSATQPTPQTDETPQPQVQVPAVPVEEPGTTGEGAAPVPEAGVSPVGGSTGLTPPVEEGVVTPEKGRHDPGKVKMVVRILARQGVDPETASEIAEDLLDDAGDTSNSEELREKVMSSFKSRGGVFPNESTTYSEDASTYEAAGDTPEEAAQKAENARAFNELQRRQDDETNRGIVGRKAETKPKSQPLSPTPRQGTIYDMDDDELLDAKNRYQRIASQAAVNATDESGPGTERDLAETASKALAAANAEIEKRRKAGKFNPKSGNAEEVTPLESIIGPRKPGSLVPQFVTPEGATVEVLEDGKVSFMVPPEVRGQGVGNAAVQRVKDYADATGNTITLDIEPLGNEPSMTRDQLADWYERRGFTVSEDRKSAVYQPTQTTNEQNTEGQPGQETAPETAQAQAPVEGGAQGVEAGGAGAVSSRFLDIAPDGVLYRADLTNPTSSKMGAFFFSGDKNYTDNYLSEDRTLVTAAIPEKTLDIRSESDRKIMLDWLIKEADRLDNSDRVKSYRSASDIRKALAKPNQMEGINQAFAIADLARAEEAGIGIYPGMSYKAFLEYTGYEAMTVGESITGTRDKPADFSFAILNPEFVLPEGYVRQGDLYIHQPTQTNAPIQRNQQQSDLGERPQIGEGGTPSEASGGNRDLSVEGGPEALYSVQALADAFDLTDEQAVVADAIAQALGARIDVVAKGGTPGSGALSQAQTEEQFNKQVESYVNPEWDSLSETEKYEDLVKFADQWIKSLGGRKVDGSHAVFDAGGDTITLGTTSLRRGVGSVDLRKSVMLYPEEQTHARVDDSAGIRIEIAYGPTIDSLFAGDSQTEAKIRLAREIQEELIHAAQLLAAKRRVGPKATRETIYGEIGSLFNDLISQATTPEAKATLRNTLVSSIRAYQKSENLYRGQSLDQIVSGMNDFTKAVVMVEMVRQVVQLRNSGQISEVTVPGMMNRLTKWVEEVLTVLKQLAANPSVMGPRFAREIRDTEAVLASLKGEEPLYQATSADTARFNELTRDLPASPTQADLDAWKASHPDEYQELKAMRERVLRGQGYDVGPVYHGTNADFTIFDAEMGGLVTGARSARQAFFLVDDQSVAGQYAKLAVDETGEGSERIISGLLSGNLKTVDHGGKSYDERKFSSELTQAKSEGYEGVKFLNTDDSVFKELTGFEPLPEVETEVSPDGKSMSFQRGGFKARGEVLSNGMTRLITPGGSAELVRSTDPVRVAAVFEDISNRVISPKPIYKENRHTVYAVFDPTQIKSTEPLSLSPEGRLITPDQWGDTGSPSILYQDAKASFEITESGKILLRGLQNPDFSSAVHEIAHAARRTMDQVLDEKEVRTVEQWAGVKNGKWGRYNEEKWARAWERYFREGKAPLARLQGIFDKIAGWMTQVYQNIVGSDIDVEITPEIRAIFDKLAGRMEQTLPEEMLTPPPVEPPNFDAAPDPNSPTGLYHAQSDEDRARLGLPPRFKQPRSTDQAAWDRAVAAEDAHRAAGKPGTAGTDLLTNLLNDVPRVLTKDEHALLLHEKLVREQAVNAAQAKLNDLSADAPEGVRKDAQAGVKAAQDAFDLLLTYADAAGSRAGLSLQARKMLVYQDFTLAAVVNRLKAAKNLNSDKPAEWTAKDQAAAVEIANKLQQAQERVEALEAENSEQVALIEQLTRDVERAQTKLENRLRTSKARAAIKAKLDPKIEEAKARIEARRKANKGVVNMAMMPTPDMLADLKDYAIIYSAQFVKGAVTLNAFSEQVIREVGDWIAPHVENLFRMARAHYIETAESVTGDEAPTPDTVVESIDAKQPLDKVDIWRLARAHVVAGLRGRNVLDAVFNDLVKLYPSLTREVVSEEFTGYGKVTYPSTKEVPKELRRIRALEREYAKQLDIAAGQMPKRTGYQGDAKKDTDWAEVRAEQQKTADALRELENQLREAGLPVPADDKKLANALNTKKRRLTNEIEEIELALKSKTPRTPKTRTPIADDAEVAELEKRLAEKRKEYADVFDQTTAREKRILASLKRRTAELERRMRERDFTAKPKLEPVNTEAKRKADFEFEKVKSKYDEMRHNYILANAPISKKAGHYALSTANLMKLLTLGFDVGVLMRQLGTTYQALTRDMGMLAPTKEGAKKRADGSYLKRILSEGVKAFGSAEYEHAAYESLRNRPNAGWDKTAGLVLNAPFDVHRNTKEDIPPANLLDNLPWWLWPALMTGKVVLGGVSLPASSVLLALSAVQKPLMQGLDRAQRTMTNQSRALFFDEAMNALHDNKATVEDAKAIAKAVMVGTGRGTATQMVESAMPLANQFLLATRYYISRMQALSLYPLWNKDARQAPAARKEIQKMYARSVAGRATLLALAVMAFGKSLSGDDEEPQEGLIVDPTNPNFGRVRLAEGVNLDFMSGLNNFASFTARYFMRMRTDPETGRRQSLGAGYTQNLNDEVMRFVSGKRNVMFSFVTNYWAGAFYGGKPATMKNALEEATTAIIINDTMNVYKAMIDEYGPVKGSARASLFMGLMLTGAGTSVQDSEAEKEALRIARAEASWARKMREAELNQ